MSGDQTTQKYLSVLGACMTQFMVIGILFAYAIFFTALEEEFGWSRALLSAANSVAFFLMGVFAIFAGRLNDRFGPRIVLAVSGVMYAVGVVLLSRIDAPWQLVAIFAVFISLGMSTHDVVTLSTIARWFERRRGLMTGVTKTGTALGQMALPPIAAWLILTEGWRSAAMILGVAAGLVLFTAAMLMRAPEGGAGQTAPKTGQALEEARRGRIFWTMAAVQFLVFATLTTIPLHVAIHGKDLGMSLETASLLLSTMGAASIAGRLTIGAFSDRLGGRNGYLLCLGPMLAALLLLLIVRDPVLLFPAVALYGFAHGGCFTIVSPTVAEMFGTRAHGAIFGLIIFAGTLSGAVMPTAAGAIYDEFGGYDAAFVALAVMVALAMALAASLPRRA